MYVVLNHVHRKQISVRDIRRDLCQSQTKYIRQVIATLHLRVQMQNANQQRVKEENGGCNNFTDVPLITLIYRVEWGQMLQSE